MRKFFVLLILLLTLIIILQSLHQLCFLLQLFLSLFLLLPFLTFLCSPLFGCFDLFVPTLQKLVPHPFLFVSLFSFKFKVSFLIPLSSICIISEPSSRHGSGDVLNLFNRNGSKCVMSELHCKKINSYNLYELRQTNMSKTQNYQLILQVLYKNKYKSRGLTHLASNPFNELNFFIITVEQISNKVINIANQKWRFIHRQLLWSHASQFPLQLIQQTTHPICLITELSLSTVLPTWSPIRPSQLCNYQTRT